MCEQLMNRNKNEKYYNYVRYSPLNYHQINSKFCS